MDLIFNELSVQPLAKDKADGFDRVNCFLETYKRANEKDYNKIRFETPNETGDILKGISITSELTLADYRKIYMNDNSNKRYGQLLLGLPKRPYLDDDSEEADRYILNTFLLEKEGKVVNPFGLASAYLLSTPAIGFCSEPFWEDCIFNLIIEGENKNIESVFCASKYVHFNDLIFNSWLESFMFSTKNSVQLVKKIFSDYDFDSGAEHDIDFWKHDKLILTRIVSLLKDIKINPFIGGLGKTESLIGRTDTYSKRIDDGNRLIYKVETNFKITIISCRGHYN
ncbi:MAG: type II toxin-antitoxin system YoeB family toxin [Draconibacterium sp.]|nr:type II toxin-antitoxin system YoeB family toxin [Draconibacterium sp.]